MSRRCFHTRELTIANCTEIEEASFSQPFRCRRHAEASPVPSRRYAARIRLTWRTDNSIIPAASPIFTLFPSTSFRIRSRTCSLLPNVSISCMRTFSLNA
jgi:hypothetical protein